MKFRVLDSDWDWSYGRGRNDYTADSLAIAYDIKSKILSWYGDCFFAMEEGIDWKNILGSKVSKEDADAAIKKIIVTEEGVTDLLFFESSIEQRKYHCTARYKDIYGQTLEVRI